MILAIGENAVREEKYKQPFDEDNIESTYNDPDTENIQ